MWFFHPTMALDASINPTVANESVAPQSRVFQDLVETAFANPDPCTFLMLSPADRRIDSADQTSLPVQPKNSFNRKDGT
jgi:hypothetical protein